MCRHLRSIGADVDSGLGGAIEVRTARIAPDHDGETGGLGFCGQFSQFLHLGEREFAARIDRETDSGATQPKRVLNARGNRLILVGRQAVGAVALQNCRYLTGERVGTLCDHAKRRGVSVQPSFDRELIMVVRVVRRRVGSETPRGAVLEALVDG